MALLETTNTEHDNRTERPAKRSATSRWRLDDRTREIGKQGVAAAREALAEAVRRTAA